MSPFLERYDSQPLDSVCRPGAAMTPQAPPARVSPPSRKRFKPDHGLFAGSWRRTRPRLKRLRRRTEIAISALCLVLGLAVCILLGLALAPFVFAQVYFQSAWR